MVLARLMICKRRGKTCRVGNTTHLRFRLCGLAQAIVLLPLTLAVVVSASTRSDARLAIEAAPRRAVAWARRLGAPPVWASRLPELDSTPPELDSTSMAELWRQRRWRRWSSGDISRAVFHKPQEVVLWLGLDDVELPWWRLPPVALTSSIGDPSLGQRHRLPSPRFLSDPLLLLRDGHRGPCRPAGDTMAGGGGVEARGGGCVRRAEVKMGMNGKRRERE
jgi:hypothetical protein